MKTFTLTIELENDALVDDQGDTDLCALAELIVDAAHAVRDQGRRTVRDANGNTVGAWAIKERDA